MTDAAPPRALDNQVGVLIGWVGASSDGSDAVPLAGAIVEVAGQSAITAPDGRFEITGLPAGVAVARVSAEDHVTRLRQVRISTGGRTLLAVDLQARGDPDVFDVPEGSRAPLVVQRGMSRSGRRLGLEVLPADLVVEDDGVLRPVRGRVEVDFTAIDPPSLGAPDTTPAPLEGITDAGALRGLVSLGMFDVEVHEVEGDVRRKAQIREGGLGEAAGRAHVTLDLGPADEERVGDYIPLWVLDEQSGMWREEPRARAVVEREGDRLVGRAALPHFSSWNYDYIADALCVEVNWTTLPGEGALEEVVGGTLQAIVLEAEPDVNDMDRSFGGRWYQRSPCLPGDGRCRVNVPTGRWSARRFRILFEFAIERDGAYESRLVEPNLFTRRANARCRDVDCRNPMCGDEACWSCCYLRLPTSPAYHADEALDFEESHPYRPDRTAIRRACELDARGGLSGDCFDTWMLEHGARSSDGEPAGGSWCSPQVDLELVGRGVGNKVNGVRLCADAQPEDPDGVAVDPLGAQRACVESISGGVQDPATGLIDDSCDNPLPLACQGRGEAALPEGCGCPFTGRTERDNACLTPYIPPCSGVPWVDENRMPACRCFASLTDVPVVEQAHVNRFLALDVGAGPGAAPPGVDKALPKAVDVGLFVYQARRVRSIRDWLSHGWSVRSDMDHDDHPDVSDNCPQRYNPDQADTNQDGRGDPCDVSCHIPAGHPQRAELDPDQDGIATACDNLPNVANADQFEYASCHEARLFPGCDDAACQACVCGDPLPEGEAGPGAACCVEGWSDDCVARALDECSAACAQAQPAWIDACPTTREVIEVDRSVEFIVSTRDRPDLFVVPRIPNRAPDRVIELTLEEPSAVRIDANTAEIPLGQAFPAVLELRRGCTPDAPSVAAVADSPTADGIDRQPLIVDRLEAGVYYLIVTGLDDARGALALAIDISPAVEGPCLRRGPVCDDACPLGQRCDAACAACEPLPECETVDGRCLARCPAEFECDEGCGACIPAVACHPEGGECRADCPPGHRCDDDCQSCVAEPDWACQRRGDDGLGHFDLCVDSCGPGRTCDLDCRRCVAAPAAGCALTADRRCLDACPVGTLCDGDCAACQPVACGLGADGACGGDCPGGSACDMACSACVPEAIVEGAFGSCSRNGRRCIDACVDGFACDGDCAGCVPAAGLCRRSDVDPELCTDECPDGFRCTEDCGACEPDDGAAPAGPCRRGEDAEGGAICLSDCPDGLVCDEDCQRCENPCVDRGGACFDRCPRGTRCDGGCSACVPTGCSPVDGVCLEDCVGELQCNAGCDACEVPIERCARGDEGQCIDRCPAGQVCDGDCGGCVPGRCTPNAGLCRDRCPAGSRCSADCRTCEPQALCRWDADLAVCDDDCPAGTGCDAGCAVCVPQDGARCRRDGGDRCVDQCPDGQRCDDACGGCVVDVPCQSDGLGVCLDNCPVGTLCDDTCDACVIAERCTVEEGLCHDRCPDGLRCDAGCRRCLPAAP